MREHTLIIPGHENFVARTPLGVDKYKDWFDDAVSHKAELLRISREIDRLEEELFLQAATECEKDFHFMEDNIETVEEVDGQRIEAYFVTAPAIPDYGITGREVNGYLGDHW